MFIIVSKYLKSIEEADKVLPEHRAYLDKYFSLGKFVTSGRREPRTGGVIICRAESRAEAEAIVREDPFCVKGVSEYEIIEFLPTRYAPGFEGFASK